MENEDEKTAVVLSKKQEARINIIAPLYKRGYGIMELQREVKTRLNLDTYALTTVRNDIKLMLAEWKEARLSAVDEAVTLELARIDEMIRESWSAWERSKENSVRKTQRQRALPVVSDDVGKSLSQGSQDDVAVVAMEQEQVEETNVGDPRFLQLVNQLSSERRKILGLYAPEKHEVTGANGGTIKTESFGGFNFLPWTDNLENSEGTKLAAGERPVIDYAEIVDAPAEVQAENIEEQEIMLIQDFPEDTDEQSKDKLETAGSL